MAVQFGVRKPLRWPTHKPGQVICCLFLGSLAGALPIRWALGLEITVAFTAWSIIAGMTIGLVMLRIGELIGLWMWRRSMRRLP
jgi:hypothetical protein